jgi:catechol 2,3-dioxygenase-like lactoylglutathione lyase family enzyme
MRIALALVLLSLVLADGSVLAQTPAASTGAPPTGLVVGSNNFFSPIVAELGPAVVFYRDGLGLEVQGGPADAGNNRALRDMFGLPDATLRWQIARPVPMRTGVEIIEVSGAGGAPVERRAQDAGAYTLIAIVRDIDATLGRLKSLGAPIVSLGGGPAVVPLGASRRARMVVVKDPAGHFVEIVQPDRLPETQAPPTANVVEVRVRLTVDDVERSLRLYRDALGMRVLREPEWRGDAAVADALGVHGAQYRFAVLQVPTSGLVFELVDYKGVDRRKVAARIQDPGSTRIQLQVRDMAATIAAMQKFGGEVISTGGRPLDLPAGASTLKVAIVRDPDNLFVVLIESPQAAAAPR